MTLTSETGVRSPAGTFRMTPARWVTLAIGVPVILALIGWTGFSVVSRSVRGSFTVSYALPVQQGQLTASVQSGDLNVRTGRGGTTAHLAGTVGYGLFRPQVTRTTTAGGTAVDVNCAALAAGECGLSATLEVPPLTGLTLSTGGGNLTVPGVAQAVNLASDGGDVTVSGIPGGTEVSSGGGNLTASDLGGTLRFTTDGGDISGDDLAAPTVDAGSGGGNVTLVFTSPPKYLNLTSDGGDVTVLLPRGDTAYDVSTTPDGGDNNVSVKTTGSQVADQVTIGSGGGNISVRYAP